jgi:hypothetical protein
MMFSYSFTLRWWSGRKKMTREKEGDHATRRTKVTTSMASRSLDNDGEMDDTANNG